MQDRFRLPGSSCLINAQDKAQLGPLAGCWCQFPEMAKLGEGLDGGENPSRVMIWQK